MTPRQIRWTAALDTAHERQPTSRRTDSGLPRPGHPGELRVRFGEHTQPLHPRRREPVNEVVHVLIVACGSHTLSLREDAGAEVICGTYPPPNGYDDWLMSPLGQEHRSRLAANHLLSTAPAPGQGPRPRTGPLVSVSENLISRRRITLAPATADSQ